MGNEAFIRENDSIWNNMPLQDYEAHMSHASTGQLQLLNALTKKYLDILEPFSCIFLGVAGGNGLEHIVNNITRQVVAVDINRLYLEITRERFAGKIRSLKTIQANIAQNPSCIIKANLVWAALILEYTGIDEALAFCTNNIAHGGSVVVTIQCNNGVNTVSDTGIESIKQAAAAFTIVEPAVLVEKAALAGFVLMGEEENILPNGKSFKTYWFKNGEL
jgi:hypothetical protein